MQQQAAPPMALPPPISSGQGSGPAPGPQVVNNVTYNNNGASEDRAETDLTYHLNRQNQNMPGQRGSGRVATFWAHLGTKLGNFS